MKKARRKFSVTVLSALLSLSLAACGAAPESGTALAQPANLSVQAETSQIQKFVDVPVDAWFAEAVNWCRENGIMSGTTDTTFAPQGTMSRGMLATVLYRMAGSPEVIEPPSFQDVSLHGWYSEGIAWAAQNDVMSGYGNGLFGPDDPITREQLAAVLWRYAGTESNAQHIAFADSETISSYAVEAVEWAAANGIITGRDGNLFAPRDHATRAETAVILYRYLNRQEEGGTPVPPENQDGAPEVFMTTDLTADGLIAIYEALEASPTGNIAVKLSTGEPGSNYLRTDLIGPLVQSLDDPTIVECNTAYGGSRANTAMHYQVAEDHGYTAIADVDIMDEEGSMTLPVEGGTNLTENYVGGHFADYDYFVVLSHFKGHSMAGFGGAIKNISIGIASAEGKSHIHSGGTGGSMWGGSQDAFLESMAEAGKSVVDALDGNILYINVMNRLSVDCDCEGSPAEPDMHDIGILASYDPVALDQACVDLVYAAEDGQSLVNRIESRNGLHTLEHAEDIGLGSRDYELVSIDD